MTLTYTSRMKLAVPDFLTEPWHSEFAQAMDSIDRLVFNALLMQGAALWTNSTAYVIGDIVISPDTGALYTCAAPHTSSASPQTFTAELVAHPTFWMTTGPTLATQAEAEAGVDNTKFMSPLRTKQAITALTSQTALFTPRAGQLTRVSASQLKFSPFNGNKIKVNGVLYDIPAAGIAGLNNTGVYVSGVPGANLSPNTSYTVFAEIHGGIVTANFASVGHRPSQTVGNEGVEVGWNGSTEFPNSSVIGIIRTNGSSQFADDGATRWVRSWFNDPGVSLVAAFTAGRNFSNTGSYAEINAEARVQWLSWANEPVMLAFNGSFFSTTSAAIGIFVSIGIDTATPVDTYARRGTGANSESNDLATTFTTINLSEGNHFAMVLGFVTAGTAQVIADVNSAGNRPTLKCFIAPRG